MKELIVSPPGTPLPFPLLHACASANFLEVLIVNSPIAIVTLDQSHRFTMANPAFLQLFRYNAEDLQGAEFDEMIAAPGTEQETRRLSATVLRGNKVHAITRRRRSDGSLIDVEVFGIPLLEDGRLAGVYGIYQDLTERTRAQTALRGMADRLEALQQAERQRVSRESNGLEAQRRGALSLTRRERSVLHLLAGGVTNKEIAVQLGISVRTVESHRISMNQKCGFRSVADLVRFAIRQEPDRVDEV